MKAVGRYSLTVVNSGLTVFLSQHDNSVTTNPINISASDKMFIEEDLFRYQKSLWKTIWPQGLPEYVKAIKWQNKNKHTIQHKVFNLIFYFKFGFLVHNCETLKSKSYIQIERWIFSSLQLQLQTSGFRNRGRVPQNEDLKIDLKQIYLSKYCSLFPIQLYKILRLRVKHIESLLLNKE